MFPDLGLEKIPDEFIERMVIIFREVRRVLRDDGVVWVNLGDCFAGSGGENLNKGLSNAGTGKDRSHLYRNNPRKEDITAGNLMLMPHRVAIALQDDGWVVRNDVVWFKRNPMPESVAGWRWEKSRSEKARTTDGGMQTANIGSFTAQSGGRDKVEWEYGDDLVLRKSSWRHTRAHEYVFQLVKDMGYWCNQEAVREKMVSSEEEYRRAADSVRANHEFGQVAGRPLGDKSFRNVLSGRNPRSVMDVPQDEREWAGSYEEQGSIIQGEENRTGKSTRRYSPYGGANPRSVMDVPTAPYKGAHYATFPSNLIAPLIRATCPRRACPECGQGWSPVIEKENKSPATGMGPKGDGRENAGLRTSERMGHGAGWRKQPESLSQVIAYRPTCECGHEDHVPGIVLDPFGGSGTTGMVARELQRRWVVMDISYPYLDEQAKIRTRSGTPSKALDGLPLFEGLEDTET
jgi:DNA modification methylase